MNAQQDVNLTAIFEREGIHRITRFAALDSYSVVLSDGRTGAGRTVGQALDKAKQPHAENVLRAA